MLLLNKFRNFFLDLFFPKKCLGCGIPDTYLCRDCFSRLSVRQNKTSLLGEGHLDRIFYAGAYTDPLIRDLIRGFKYQFVKELTEPLSELLIKTIESFHLQLQMNPDYFLIIPIPLYKTRERSRGFNQAELLAKKLADYFKIPIKTDVLTRIIHTAPQARITDTEQRKTNTKNVFFAAPNSIEGKIVILVDDVITTGATLMEAAKILKQSGAKEVWALTVAKG